jgi:hypothetical protein
MLASIDWWMPTPGLPKGTASAIFLLPPTRYGCADGKLVRTLRPADWAG